MPALIERPQMSRAMWEALKAHILKERQKKKQEQEADAAIERLRRERENKQKQDVMTLEETKEQIQQLEIKLAELKEEKHQLFLQLKKVLNEDEIRRRSIPKETNDALPFGHGYPSASLQIGHPTVFMQTGTLGGRNPLYKLGPSHQQSLIPSGAMKRPRSPSPPPGNNYYGYFKPQNLAAYNQKPGQYINQPVSYYQTSNAPHSTSSTYSTINQVSYSYSGHPQYPSTTSSDSVPGKHMSHGHHIQHLQGQGYVPSLHQSMESSASHKGNFSEDKYFGIQQHSSIPLRNMNLHPQTLMTLQQQQTSKPGGITTGYPVRGPPVTSGTSFQSQPHVTYAGQQGGSRHLCNNPAPAASRYY